MAGFNRVGRLLPGYTVRREDLPPVPRGPPGLPLAPDPEILIVVVNPATRTAMVFAAVMLLAVELAPVRIAGMVPGITAGYPGRTLDGAITADEALTVAGELAAVMNPGGHGHCCGAAGIIPVAALGRACRQCNDHQQDEKMASHGLLPLSGGDRVV